MAPTVCDDKENLANVVLRTPGAGAKAAAPRNALRDRIKGLLEDDSKRATPRAQTPRATPRTGALGGLAVRSASKSRTDGAGAGTGDHTDSVDVARSVSLHVAAEEAACRGLPQEERQARLGAVYLKATRDIDGCRGPERTRVWLSYALLQAETSVEEARDAFRHMKVSGIGSDDAEFYVTWARFEVEQHETEKARSILLKARERGARLDQTKVLAALAELGPEDDTVVMPSAVKRTPRAPRSSPMPSPGGDDTLVSITSAARRRGRPAMELPDTQKMLLPVPPPMRPLSPHAHGRLLRARGSGSPGRT